MNTEDFNLYYGATYCKLEDGNVVYLSGADSDGNVKFFPFLPLENVWDPKCPRLTSPIFQVMPQKEFFVGRVSKMEPQYGFHNGLGGSVFYIGLIPKRQNKKAFSLERIDLYIPNKVEALEAHNWTAGGTFRDLENELLNRWESRVAWAAFNPNYTAFQDACALIESGERLGVTLDKDMALVVRSNVKYPILSYKNRQIGVVGEDRTIRLFEEYGDYQQYLSRSKNSISGQHIIVEKGL